MSVTLDFINGFALGIEHIDCREDDIGLDYMIVIHLLFCRLGITKLSAE